MHKEAILIGLASIFALYLVGVIPAYWLIRASYGREAGNRTLMGSLWVFLILVSSIIFIVVIWQVVIGNLAEPGQIDGIFVFPLGLTVLWGYVDWRIKSGSMGRRLIFIGRDAQNRSSIVIGYIFVGLVPFMYIHRLIFFDDIYLHMDVVLAPIMIGTFMIMCGSLDNYFCEEGICIQASCIRWARILELGWARDKAGVLLFATKWYRQHKVSIPAGKVGEVKEFLQKKLPNVPVMKL